MSADQFHDIELELKVSLFFPVFFSRKVPILLIDIHSFSA
jgi:hypothetical protein